MFEYRWWYLYFWTAQQVKEQKCCSIAQQFCLLCRTQLQKLRKCLIHIAALTHRVDGVHVCGLLTILSCLTYIFPTHSPTILALFFTVWPDPFGPPISPFWARHQIFLKKVILMFTIALTLMHTAATHNRQWPSSKQWLCQSQQILKNNIWVIYKNLWVVNMTAAPLIESRGAGL